MPRKKAGPLLPEDYSALLGHVKARIQSASLHALRGVNRELISLYNLGENASRLGGWMDK